MKCDGCTLCCELFNIPWMNSPPGKRCKHCNGSGCDIYKNAPKQCLDFKCAYLQMKKVSINMRPDKCGIIFEKIADDIFYGSLHPSYNLNDYVKKQISIFLNEGYSVVIESLKFKKLHIYPTINISSGDLFKKVKKIIEERNGRSNI